MTSAESKYLSLPGNASLQVVVDAWRCKPSGGFVVSLRVNRTLPWAGKNIRFYEFLEEPETHPVSGSTKAGVAISHPQTTLHVTGFKTPSFANNRTVRYVWLTGQPALGNYFIPVWFNTSGPAIFVPMSPPLHWPSFPLRGTTVGCGGGY